MREEQLVNLRQLAQRLGISSRYAAELAIEGMPRRRRAGRWGYPVATCRRWYGARRRATAANKATHRQIRTKLDAARLEKARATCDRAEREFQDLTRSLVTVAEGARMQREAIAKMRRATARLPAEWAARFTGLVDEGTATEALRLFVNGIYAALATSAGAPPEGDVGADSPAAPPPATLEDARARRWTAEARCIVLKAAAKEGALVTVQAWLADATDRYSYTRAAIQGIEGRGHHVMALADAQAAERALRTLLHEALRALDGLPGVDQLDEEDDDD